MAVFAAAVVRTVTLAVGGAVETIADAVGWALLAETVGVGSPLGAALTSNVGATRTVLDGGVSSAASEVLAV